MNENIQNSNNNDTANPELRKTLGKFAIILITFSFIFKSSIFYLPQLGMRYAGPASIFVWIALFVIAFYVAYAFAELLSMMPITGGVYEIGKKAFGPFISFIIAWIVWIGGNIGATLSIVAGVEYAYPSIEPTAYYFKFIFCVVIIILLNMVALSGMKTSKTFLFSLSILTLLVAVFLIIPLFVDIPLLKAGGFGTPFSFEKFNPLYPLPGGFLGNIFLMLGTLFVVSEAFFGLESVSFMSGEVKEPQKSLPKAMLIAMAAVGIITILFVLGTIGFSHGTEFTHEFFKNSYVFYPKLMTEAYGSFNFSNIIVLISFLIYIGATASWIISSPRLIYSVAKDDLFPTQFKKIHPKFRTPHIAILFQTIVINIFVAWMYYEYLWGNIGDPYRYIYLIFVLLILPVLCLMLLAIPVLRKKIPDAIRPYKLPFGMWMPIVIILLFIITAISWIMQIENGLTGLSVVKQTASILILGIPFYLLLSFNYDPDSIIKLTDLFANYNLWLEGFILPPNLRKHILKIHGENYTLLGKNILEYGAGVGTLTKHLAEEVGSGGTIYATELSYGNAKILAKRMKRLGYYHVTPIHDPHQVNRLHPDVGNVDVIFSVGFLSYMQDLKKILKEMHNVMPEGGRICFVDYVNFFKILPDTGWLASLAELEQIFKKAGFAIKIEKKKGLFWNYIFIYGIKSDRGIVFI